MAHTATKSGIIIPDVAAKLAAIPEWQETNRGIVGRRREMAGFCVSLATRGHVLYYGEPGVAKSMTVDAVLKHIDLSKFKTQAYKASPPEQFLGMISMKGMMDDEFRRLIARKAPDAEIVNVDELARAPRAVLPSFQGMMVEREFDSGDGVQPVPLITFVGTLNHLLESDTELNAFFDRFVLKFIVKGPQSQDEFKRMMKAGRARRLHDPEPPDELIISRDELLAFQQHVLTVHVPDDVDDAIAELWSNVAGIGLNPSPRRYETLQIVLQGVAAIDGRDEVLIDDMQIAADSLWTAPSEEPIVRAEVLKFASEWVREAAAMIDAFGDTMERFGQVQALVASGSSPSDTHEIAEKTQSLTNHAIAVANDNKTLRGSIEKHIADAQGRDTSELDAVLTQMDAQGDWITDRILGGLRI